MLIALMADIHANREALEACLSHADARGVERTLFLGDYVGYGADPEWVIGAVRERVAGGGVALLGNHDAAVGGRAESMDSQARAAIEWTQGQLGPADRKFLSELPPRLEEDGRLFVHADAVSPRSWTYVADTNDARRSMRATTCRITFCGHVHKPMLYSMSEIWDSVSEMWKLVTFRPVAGASVPLASHRRWLAVLGSVGQPRDGNPAASYAVFDTTRSELTYFRVPYDVDAAAAKILAAGLPGWLAERLRKGV
jgi:diadenosine tetraphosphatase ApaH/serine/threonine PP2A family protein phosphatase